MDDPRLTPARPDLAAKYLEGKVRAARFVEGEEFCVVEAIAPLREGPAADAMLSTQALKGERFTIYDRDSEGLPGQLNGDGYVGGFRYRDASGPRSRPQGHGAPDIRFGPLISWPRSRRCRWGCASRLPVKMRFAGRAKAGICSDGMSAASRRWKKIRRGRRTFAHALSMGRKTRAASMLASSRFAQRRHG